VLDAREEERSPDTTIDTEPGKGMSLINTDACNCASLISKIQAENTKLINKY
jgi:hypothetical protein